jgi:hypothetical protein
VTARLFVEASRTLSAGQLQDLLRAMLDASGLDYDARVELLGGMLVAEAVRPHWEAGCDAQAAHEALRAADPELASAVEAISPMLLGRAGAREEASAALGEVERLLG